MNENRMEVKDVAPGEEKLYYFFQSEQIYYLENIKSIRRGKFELFVLTLNII